MTGIHLRIRGGYSDGMGITTSKRNTQPSSERPSVPKYSFGKKDKLPKGMAYPLKRSVLDAALTMAALSKLQCVYYTRGRKGSDIVLRATYCGEGRIGWAGAGLASIWVHAVSSNDRSAIERAVISEMLPKMLRWLGDLEHAGNTSRGIDQDFWAAWSNGTVSFAASTLL